MFIFHGAQIGRRRRAHKNYVATASTDLVDRSLCSDENLLDIFVVDRKWREKLMPDCSVMVAQLLIMFKPAPEPCLAVRILYPYLSNIMVRSSYSTPPIRIDVKDQRAELIVIVEHRKASRDDELDLVGGAFGW
jgi:hypothetical protein